jgi:IS30 family transposase
LSGNAWSNIEVEGWSDFCKNRKKSYRLKREDQIKIKELYLSGASLTELATLYSKHISTIRKIIKDN